jgi:hypothetical protein
MNIFRTIKRVHAFAKNPGFKKYVLTHAFRFKKPKNYRRKIVCTMCSCILTPAYLGWPKLGIMSKNNKMGSSVIQNLICAFIE